MNTEKEMDGWMFWRFKNKGRERLEAGGLRKAQMEIFFLEQVKTKSCKSEKEDEIFQHMLWEWMFSSCLQKLIDVLVKN